MESPGRTDIPDSIQVNRGKFQYYNQAKLTKLYASLTNPHVIDLLEAIPLLLISNHPSLPGYVEGVEMPTGIHNYIPSHRGMNFLGQHFPSARQPNYRSPKPFVHMFALMGSGGTIAFNDLSDLDFWVCIDEGEYGQEIIAHFKTKCRRIENWVEESYHTEIHFFLNDITKVRNNIFDDDSEENFAGGLLGELLKEEFFRSSIILCGKIPFWWVTPPDSNDRTYEAWLAVARDAGLMQEYVDLGNLYNIIREDFLGAALFQILKSLGHPFKSILKLGLLERYLHSSSNNPFISNIIKKNVHSGKLDVDSIDSYVIMFNYVFEFYSAITGDTVATELLKSCFYLKVDPRLSQYLNISNNPSIPEKSRKMLEYTQSWNWNFSHLSQMDDFENWDIESVNKLWGNTKKYILKGYKDILSRMQTQQGLRKFTTEELKGISRRILSHFEVSETKIDNSLSFKTYPPEKLLSIEFIRDREGKESWFLSKRIIIRNYPTKIIIHKEKTFLGLIVWTGLNNLYKKDFTRLEIATGIHQMDPNFIRELTADLSLHFSSKKMELHNSYIFKDPFPVMSYVIINPYSKYAKKLEEIFFLYHNSWGETRFERFERETDLCQITSRVLTGALFTGSEMESALRIIASQPYQSSKELHRHRDITQEMFRYFVENRNEVKKRYVTMIGNTYIMYSNARQGQDDIITCSTFDTEIKLLYTLSYNTGLKKSMLVDKTVPELNYLRIISEKNRDNAVQIYFQKAAKYCYFFISDERGSLMFFRKNAADFTEYLARLYLFTVSLVDKVKSAHPESPLAKALVPIEVYQMDRDLKNNVNLTQVNLELERNIQEAIKNVVPLQLSLHLTDNGEVGYRFSLPDGGYSEVMTRGELQNVASEMQTLLSSVRGYSYFVSDVNLSHLELRLYTDYTSYAFTEKNRFELLIEKSLRG